MDLLKKIGIFFAAVAMGITAFLTSVGDAESAVITAITAVSGWSVEKAFKVVDPDGKEFACVVGEWDGDTEATHVNLECVVWTASQSYLGNEDGSLTLVK